MELEKQLNDLNSYTLPKITKSKIQFADIIHAGDSPLVEILELTQKVSTDAIPVLIMGETGTGKEMIAQLIHRSSPRFDRPFIAVNCGALVETLLESELFGHEKGSFTGATSQRKGRFELADGGTIFLDEISETSMSFQAKLLRVLQENRFERVGGERAIRVDVRLIAATNKNLKDCVDNGRFREDLFYRLNVFPITLPPLRDRKNDIPLLALHFLRKYHQNIKSFSDEAVRIFTNYPWPGNVRELENIVRRAAILAQSYGRTMIQANDLPTELLNRGKPDTLNIYKSLEDQILEMLRSLNFSHTAVNQTARALGNRDRGTITEYFRGICFEYLERHQFKIADAARAIVASTDQEALKRVQKKITEYLNNLKSDLKTLQDLKDIKSHPAFKGLPKKYHDALLKVMENLILS